MSRIVDIEPLLHKYDGMNEGTEFSPIHFINDLMALEQEPITWIVGKDNCQVAVRNMPIDKMQRICAIIGEEEQQPCEDCISREAVIKHLENITMDTNPDHYDSKDKWYQANGFNLCKVGIEMYVADLPSVTPKGVTVTDFADRCRECGKQKVGKWIRETEESLKGYYRCSICGRRVNEVDDYLLLDEDNEVSDIYPYCHCGAKMEDSDVR